MFFLIRVCVSFSFLTNGMLLPFFDVPFLRPFHNTQLDSAERRKPKFSKVRIGLEKSCFRIKLLCIQICLFFLFLLREEPF